MSDAMNEVYREARADFSAEMLSVLFPNPKRYSVEERSREAVKRIFDAVDEARAEAESKHRRKLERVKGIEPSS